FAPNACREGRQGLTAFLPRGGPTHKAREEGLCHHAVIASVIPAPHRPTGRSPRALSGAPERARRADAYARPDLAARKCVNTKIEVQASPPAPQSTHQSTEASKRRAPPENLEGLPS